MATPKGRRWWMLAGLAIWTDLLILSAGFGVLCANVEYSWMRAGPVRSTTRHAPAPGQTAQERDETHWLIGRDCVARVPLRTTTLDFGRAGADANSIALAWHFAEQSMSSVMPTLGGAGPDPDGPGPMKLPGWFPLIALSVTTAAGGAVWPLSRALRRACSNPPME